MTVSPEQLHLATQYPYDPPHESFLFVNGLGLAIVEPAEDPLVDARVRVDDRVMNAADALRELGAADTPGMAMRTPILSYGSNTSPFGIGRKYERLYGDGPVVIPAIACDLDGYDVVYSPHFSRWGTIPATIAVSPGTTARLIVLYLAPDQLQLMNDIECGPPPARGGNYVFGRLAKTALRLEGAGMPADAPTYVSHYGVLALNSQPVALAAIKAERPPVPGVHRSRTACAGAERIVRWSNDRGIPQPVDQRCQLPACLHGTVGRRRASRRSAGLCGRGGLDGNTAGDDGEEHDPSEPFVRFERRQAVGGIVEANAANLPGGMATSDSEPDIKRPRYPRERAGKSDANGP